MDRRKFLAIAGGGIVLAAGAAFGTRITRTPDQALIPWSAAGSAYTEPRSRALSFAILAPNPHNRQPWMVDLSVPGQVTLLVDTDRLLPHTDPFNRQITIGLGCFLEVMTLAAAQEGFRVDLDLFPEGSSEQALDRRPVAVATFVKDPAVGPDPLFRHVLARRSHKEAYDLARPVPSEVLERVQRAAIRGTRTAFSNQSDNIDALRALTHEAMRIEIHTERTFKESVDLFRIGKTEIEANPDGIDFSGPMFETMHLLGLFTRAGTLDPTSTEFAQGEAAVMQTTDTAMAHLWLTSPANTRADQIVAGRDWVRINLAATAEGVALHPLSQVLQEYPEMEAVYDKAHQMLAPGGGTLQMLGRLGYAEPVPASPRWPLESRIIGS
jgi:hypothetical protein